MEQLGKMHRAVYKMRGVRLGRVCQAVAGLCTRCRGISFCGIRLNSETTTVSTILFTPPGRTATVGSLLHAV